ncbi:sarcosine oxidase subunit delta [Thiomicrorhabdus sp. Kp2]|uniref:sarcosine oxidase subunit delta n=1 Tax=Thiomicrorhabdus sp. Kp2 TaxID=1123518 RepID=UPI0003F9B951|nr:sarcosine oxidase subunit delta [Thiomicrorhabdus sp. Kp2]
MKFITCPPIGRRALSEFTYGGLVKNEPGLEDLTEKAWADHVFYRHSHPQLQKEWWYHRSTGMWFFFERNTLTDVISNVCIAKKDC